MDPEYSYDDGTGPVFCKARNGDCWDDLCCDYGCALMAGMLPDRDETFDLEEDAPALSHRRPKSRDERQLSLPTPPSTGEGE